MTTPLAAPGYYDEPVDRARRSPDASRRAGQGLLDPSLLQDLAEALDFLHRQVDETESDLERSREQSHAFEQDARHWQDEAARLRDEGGQTRSSLEALREEFEQTKESASHQHYAVDQVVAELAELRAARTQVEELAAEQQRALVLSLELLRRVQPLPSQVALVEKDRQIEELTRRVQAAGEEGTRRLTDLAAELEATRSECLSLRARLETPDESGPALHQSQLATLASELESARTEARALQLKLESLEPDGHQAVEPSAILVELALARSEAASLRAELESVTLQVRAEQTRTGAHQTAVASDLELARAEIDSLQARLETAAGSSSRFEELLAELESVRTEVAALHAERGLKTEDLTAAQASIESLTAELALARAEVHSLSAQLEAGKEPVGLLEKARAQQARQLHDAEAEIALQNAEVESRGVIITALENALEEQTSALRGLEERFLAYAEQVQALQLQRMETPNRNSRSLSASIGRLFSPVRRDRA